MAKSYNKKLFGILFAFGIAFILSGVFQSGKEAWSSPSVVSGGSVSGSQFIATQDNARASRHSLLLPSPNYEYSLDPLHNWATTEMQQPKVYRHLNEPNVTSFLSREEDREQLNQLAPMGYQKAWSFAHQDADVGIYSPASQQFLVKNRFGGPTQPLYPGHISTSSFAPGFQRVGIVYKPGREDLKLPLFGRPTYPGGNRFEYFVLDNSQHENPLPVEDHNGLELVTDDIVSIPGFAGDFHVYLYGGI